MFAQSLGEQSHKATTIENANLPWQLVLSTHQPKYVELLVSSQLDVHPLPILPRRILGVLFVFVPPWSPDFFFTRPVLVGSTLYVLVGELLDENAFV